MEIDLSSLFLPFLPQMHYLLFTGEKGKKKPLSRFSLTLIFFSIGGTISSHHEDLFSPPNRGKENREKSVRERSAPFLLIFLIPGHKRKENKYWPEIRNMSTSFLPPPFSPRGKCCVVEKMVEGKGILEG